MSQGETVEQQLQAVAADWRTATEIKTGIGARLARLKRDGIPWRRIARETRIPETDVRRWARPHLTTKKGPAGAHTPGRATSQPLNPQEQP